MRPDITIPAADGTRTTVLIPGETNLVIIGSNGSGKSRIGSHIEFIQRNNLLVHRISAQRALSIPASARLRTLEIAENFLFYGQAGAMGNNRNKLGTRWGSNAATHLLTDFDHLLSTLFAKDVRRNEDYTRATKLRQTYAPVPDSILDTIIKVWPDIMPQNTLSFEDGKVISTKRGLNPYPGGEMSDGERVALYLLGQCLTTPDGSIVVIDEPEIHLHKSLMNRLWTKIEELCPQKVFIYITHDLDFAASRKDSKKIWIKDYLGDVRWLWEYVPQVDQLPENLVIEILGNRKNILFCEGDKDSYDYRLYQHVYSDYHIVPRGGCQKVIEATRAVNDNPAINHITAVGIIDRDYRTPEEIAALEAQHVHSVSVAEIENLLCIDPLLRIVAENLHLDPDVKVAEVTDFIIGELIRELELQVTNHAQREVQYRLNTYVKLANSLQGLQDGLTALIARIDIPAIYAGSKALFEEAIRDNDLQKALLIYNRKSLSERISPIFGLANREYSKIIFRLLKSEHKEDIVNALAAALPHL